MSAIKLSTPSSGSISLSPADTASNLTLTVPAQDGSLVTADSSGTLQFNSGYGSVATAYGCRAWVNFNGTSTVAIRASGNVSSITDNGTGDYTVNFTTAMPDVNYCVVVGGRLPTATNAVGEFYASVARSGTYSTTAVNIQTTGNSTVTARDADYCNVSIFR
jgi:hypothetical protein